MFWGGRVHTLGRICQKSCQKSYVSRTDTMTDRRYDPEGAVEIERAKHAVAEAALQKPWRKHACTEF
jgi:hypothetical protein